VTQRFENQTKGAAKQLFLIFKGEKVFQLLSLGKSLGYKSGFKRWGKNKKAKYTSYVFAVNFKSNFIKKWKLILTKKTKLR
jgi:hypothetical protein